MKHLKVAAAIATSVVTAGSLVLGSASVSGAAGREQPAAAPAFPSAWPKFTQKVTITVWGWGSNPQLLNNGFMKKYPSIKVVQRNVGAGAIEYQKLLAAEEAGSGAPDVAGVEYLEEPVFAAKHYLVDMNPLLPGKLISQIKADTISGLWPEVDQNGSLYEIPSNIGPVAFGYQPAVFKKYGLVVPKTWAQYASDAVKLHKADPKMYMGFVEDNYTNDLTALIQQAGGNFFTENSPTSWKIDIDNPISRKIYNFWGGLARKHLVLPVSEYEPSWYNQLGKDDFASYLLASWAPTYDLDPYIKGTNQTWVVTQMPQWKAGGQPTDMESGGGGDVVTSQSKDKAVLEASALYAAYTGYAKSEVGFLESPQIGNFSSSLGAATVPSFHEKIPHFVGDVNAEFAKIVSNDKTPPWQWSPWTDEVTTELAAEFSDALKGKMSFDAMLKATQDAVVKYAQAQGYTIST